MSAESGPIYVGEKVGILLADDRPQDLLVLTSVLGAPNRDLVTVTSGAEALRYLLERDFAAIVLDIMMPKMDGFELAALIRGRKRSAQTPILFLTGVGADPEALHRAYALGAVDYLTKPVDPDILRAKVEVFVQLFEKDRRIYQQAQALLEAARKNRQLELEQVKLAGLRRYRNLADAIPQIVWTADTHGVSTYFNRRWYEYTGTSPEDGSSPSWLAAIHAEDRAACEAHWNESLEEHRPLQVDCRLRGADGAYRWHLCRVLPERGADGESVGWLGTLTDLDDMFRAHRKAERAIRIRDEFLSVASHELRTPLSALTVQLGSLERTVANPKNDIPADDKAKRKVSAALRHTNRLSKLVDNLLDISRLTSQRLQLELEEFDLADMVRDVADRFSDEIRHAGCELVVRVPADAIGLWDRLRVEQVVTNLLSNAIKYGRGRPVELGVEVNAGRAAIFVRDFGIGIAAEDQVRIFDRFERAVPVQNYGGLGLGLYITRTIVEAHGGSVDVSSKPGMGSTFTASLPLRTQASEQPDMREAQ